MPKKTQQRDRRVTRRDVLKAGGAFGLFTIVPRSFIYGGPDAPSNRRTSAVIGVGGRGRGHIRGDTVAVCDVDRRCLAKAMEKFAGRRKADAYTDFREVLDRPDIDEIRIATPPHWHGLITIMAARTGRDVLCEKPLTRTVGEGRAVVETIRHAGCRFRYGDHGGGTSGRYISEVVTSGILGSPLTVYQRPAIGCNFKLTSWTGLVQYAPQPVPENMLDWDLYCGPSPLKPFHPDRIGGTHRGYWDYDGGGLTDMGVHELRDTVPAMGKDDTAPVEVHTEGPPAHPDAVTGFYRSTLTYADGMRMIIESDHYQKRHPDTLYLYLEGPKGKLYLERTGPRTDPPNLFHEIRNMKRPRGGLSRLAGLPFAEREVVRAHRVNTILNLVNISFRVGRKIRFDRVKEVVLGDEEANLLAHPPLRAPWHL